MRLHHGKIILALAAGLFAFTAQAQDEATTDMTEAEKLELFKEYGWLVSLDPEKIGMNDAEKEAFLSGIKAHLDGEPGPEDPQVTWQKIQGFLGQRFITVNKERGQEFIDSIKDKPGVQKSKSGLYYEIIEEGEGAKAGAQDSVKVNYKGTLVDGTEFDSSYKRGEPATFPVSGVVPGFGEGVQLVGKGGKVKLYIPSDLGYGDTAQRGSPIPPGSTLIFEVEMVEVNPE